jgi:hypothetical protein
VQHYILILRQQLIDIIPVIEFISGRLVVMGLEVVAVVLRFN